MDLFHLWGVGCDCIEDVDKDEEEGDEEGHPARDDVHRDEEGNPGDNHNQSCFIGSGGKSANGCLTAHVCTIHRYILGLASPDWITSVFFANFAEPNSRNQALSDLQTPK